MLKTNTQTIRRPRLYPATIVLTSLALSVVSPPVSAVEPYREEEVLVTAYYSPLPDQDHYFMGSYEKDIWLNGYGVLAADSTRVRSGMMAAPIDVPFGTRIAIPELDIVGQVHDRGGWIRETSDGFSHIDMWMGFGEEGLARAVEFGAQKLTARFYQKNMNAPRVRFDLTWFSAPREAIANLPGEPINVLTDDSPRKGDESVTVAGIQRMLQRLGYLDHDVTWFFGDKTETALRRFQRDSKLSVNGRIADRETRETLVQQINAHENLPRLLADLHADEILRRGAEGPIVRKVQRLVKLLGFYDGPIDGQFDAKLQNSVFAFQRDHEIVSSWGEAGTGMVGPQTRRALLTAWRNAHIAQSEEASQLVAVR